jgi:hypothetical protein
MMSSQYSPLTQVTKQEDSNLKFCSLCLNGHFCLLKYRKVWGHYEMIKTDYCIVVYKYIEQ